MVDILKHPLLASCYLLHDSRFVLRAGVGDEGEPSDLRKRIDAAIAGSPYPVVPDDPAYPPIADIQL